MKCNKVEKLVQERHLSPNGSLTHGKYVSLNTSHHTTFRIFPRKKIKLIKKSNWYYILSCRRCIKMTLWEFSDMQFLPLIYLWSFYWAYFEKMNKSTPSCMHSIMPATVIDISATVFEDLKLRHWNKLCMTWSATSFLTVFQDQKKMEVPLWTLIMIKWTLHMPYLPSWSGLSLWDFQLVE